jgi:class 3 adenylate cyclase
MPKPIRKLAAIVFTDIVGFTKLTADNQQKASNLLDLQRTELKPLVESYGVKWVKEVGYRY